MKIPWRQKNSKSSPTRSATKSASKCTAVTVEKLDALHVDDATGNLTAGTTTPVKKLIVHGPGDSTTVSASITSSPTVLGSGHYSPVDGSVQTFAPSNHTNTAAVQPTTLTFEQQPPHHGSSTEEEDYDNYLTPLQSSVTSVDSSSSTGTTLKEEYELLVNTTKAGVPLTAANSTLTDITTDTATVDGEEKEEDMVIPPTVGDAGSVDRPITVPPPPPPSSTTTAQGNVMESSSALPPQPSLKSPKFMRHASSFLRVSDLIGMDPTMDLSEHSHKSIPNYHCCSDAPPPGIAHDLLEQWVALDDGCGDTTNNDATMSSYTPIAQFAVDALATTALATMLDATMWVPDAKTAKIIASKLPLKSWEANTFQLQQPPLSFSSSSSTNAGANKTAPFDDDHILIWSGTFRHGLYGSEIPAIRSAAVIYMSATQLLQLLMDSNRVREYNTMSLGRTDLLTLPCRHIVTKVMRSESRPPLLRKTLQFTSILHARKLVVTNDSNPDSDNDGENMNQDSDSYLLVTRAVENPTTTSNNNVAPSNTNSVVVSEILLGVNVIRTIPNRTNACLLLSVNHVRSPLVPSLFLAKRLGLQAATNFVHDLRKCSC